MSARYSLVEVCHILALPRHLLVMWCRRFSFLQRLAEADITSAVTMREFRFLCGLKELLVIKSMTTHEVEQYIASKGIEAVLEKGRQFSSHKKGDKTAFKSHVNQAEPSKKINQQQPSGLEDLSSVRTVLSNIMSGIGAEREKIKKATSDGQKQDQDKQAHMAKPLSSLSYQQQQILERLDHLNADLMTVHEAVLSCLYSWGRRVDEKSKKDRVHDPVSVI